MIEAREWMARLMRRLDWQTGGKARESIPALSEYLSDAEIADGRKYQHKARKMNFAEQAARSRARVNQRTKARAAERRSARKGDASDAQD